MTKYIASALLFALSACSSPNKGEDKKNEAAPPETIDQPAPAPKLVDAKLSLQLVLKEDADHNLYLADVQQPLGKCLQCHGDNGAQPRLNHLPYDAMTIGLMKARANDAARPMPPTGLLPESERATLTAWLDQGAQAAPAASATANPSAYSVEVRYALEGGKVKAATLKPSEVGQMQLALGKLAAGTHLTYSLNLLNADGQVVLSQDAREVSVPDDGVIAQALQAIAGGQSPKTGTGATTDTDTIVSTDTDTGVIISTGTGTGTGSGSEDPVVIPPPPPPVVAARVIAQLNLLQPGEHSAPVVLFDDVQALFGKCMPCHARGGKSPDLTSFPFQGANGEALASVMAKIQDRVNNEQKPMPQTGLLPAAERQQLSAWIEGGYRTLPPATPSNELGAYAVKISWSAEGGAEGSQSLASDEGNYVLAAGSFAVGTLITAKVKVIGPRSTVVLEKNFAPIAVPATGEINLPLRAVAVDVTAPDAGQLGDIRGTNLTYNSLTLSWAAGRDHVTAASSLRYSVYRSNANDLDTVAEIRANGTKISSATANLLTLNVTGLTPETSYYFNVIVEDEAGNAGHYATYSVTTEEDPNVVIPTEYPNCIAGQATRQKVKAWRDAAAKSLENGDSDSTVAARIKQCFPTEVPQCVKPVLGYTLRDDIASASADGPIANAPARMPPKEFLAPGGTGLQWYIPSNVVELAKSKGWPVVRYKSRHAGGFDPETPNLLMVYVPGSTLNPPVNYDQWLNFATPKDDTANDLTPAPQADLAQDEDYDAAHNFGAGMPRVFTMVSLDRPQGGKPAQVYFQMFDRESNGLKFNPRSNSSVTSCVSCHPNGLRAISPLGLHVRAGEDQLPVEDWLAAKVINDAMDSAAGNKVVSWRSGKVNGVMKPYLNHADQGPIMGLEKPLNDQFSRSKAFIMGGTLPNGQTAQGCFNRRTTIDIRDIFGRAPGRNNVYKLSSTPSIRWDKVRDAMNCASCHNDKDRGAINDTMDMSQVDFKILVDQSMPLGLHTNPMDTVDGVAGSPNAPVKDALTGDERIALANCLQAEFQLERQQLAKSLSQTRCE